MCVLKPNTKHETKIHRGFIMITLTYIQMIPAKEVSLLILHRDGRVRRKICASITENNICRSLYYGSGKLAFFVMEVSFDYALCQS